MAIAHFIIVWFFIWKHFQKPYIKTYPLVKRNLCLDGKKPPKIDLDGKLSSLVSEIHGFEVRLWAHHSPLTSCLAHAECATIRNEYGIHQYLLRILTKQMNSILSNTSPNILSRFWIHVFENNVNVEMQKFKWNFAFGVSPHPLPLPPSFQLQEIRCFKAFVITVYNVSLSR